MNLILSDVEETIMIVDQVEGVPEGQTTVNVSHPFLAAAGMAMIYYLLVQGCKTENGHAFR